MLRINCEDNELISIIINAYNGEKYLTTAIQSVIDQTYTDWEIIFWDNQSDDKTKELVLSFNDKRIKYFYAPKHTLLYAARNEAIKYACGAYIAFLDVDDWWSPKKLELQYEKFKDKSIGAVYSGYDIFIQKSQVTKIFKNNSDLPTGKIFENLIKNYNVGILTLIIRRDIIDIQSFLFNPSFHIIGDFDFVTRISRIWRIEALNCSLATYRVHGENDSIKKHLLWRSEILKWLEGNRSFIDQISPSLLTDFEDQIEYRSILNLILHEQRNLDTFKRVLLQRNIKYIVKLLVVHLVPIFIIRKIRKF
jgi:glycosyltransferase involved in cell wall biosynthesis